MAPTMPKPITVTYTDEPSADEVVEAFADFVTLNPAAILYDLFAALRERGIDVTDLVDCVLGEMIADQMADQIDRFTAD